MSTGFLADFEDRKRQVRHYLAIVVAAERKATLGRTTRTQERRLLTLRAGTFLLLYNLIESTIRRAVDAIHDRIVTEQIPFPALNLELRKEVMRRFILGAKPDKNHICDCTGSRHQAFGKHRREANPRIGRVLRIFHEHRARDNMVGG
jgi:hypothetical protein